MIFGLTGVEPRHLATLAAVGELGSFKGAAQRLGYVQSAVSQQIAQLERALGVALVDRFPGQPAVALTEAGVVLASHAQGILGQLDAAASDLRAADRQGRELSIGVHDSTLMKVLPLASRLLEQRAPGVRIVVRDDQTVEDRARAVRRGMLDVALDDLPLQAGPFASCELLRDPIVLVVHRSSPLAYSDQRPTFEDLAGVPLVVDTSSRMQGLIESQLRAAGVQPRFALQSGLTTSVQPLVAAGIGAALMPRLSVNDRDPNVAVVDLGELLPPRRVGLYWHEQRRRLDDLDAFRDALLEACDQPSRPSVLERVAQLAMAA